MLLTFLISLLVIYIPPARSSLPFAWYWSLSGVIGLVALNFVASWLGSRTACRLLHDRTSGGSLRAIRIFKLLNIGVIGFVFLSVFWLHWPTLVCLLFSSIGERLFPIPVLADVLLLLPALVMMLTVAGFQHRAEQNRSHLKLDLRRYLVLRIRTELAILLVPWFLLVMVSDIATIFLPVQGNPLIEAIFSLALIIAIVVFGPTLLRLIWDTSSLPRGPLRKKLDNFCRAAGFRTRDILIWHTHHHLPNAAVVGLLPQIRYVLLTDALIAHCSDEEIEAIFAHEVGHIKHHHFYFYLVFALAFVCFYANAVDLLARLELVQPLENLIAAEPSEGQTLILLGFTALYWVFVFGFLSRRLEQQADLFSLRAISEPSALIAGLQKLAAVSGTPQASGSWRHFSIARRVQFLKQALEDSSKADRKIRWTQIVQLLVIALFVTAAVRLLLLTQA